MSLQYVHEIDGDEPGSEYEFCVAKVRKMQRRQGPICDKRTPDGTGNKFGGGVSGLTVMLSDRGRTMGWTCQKEYSVSLKKMSMIIMLTFFNGVLGNRTKKLKTR